MMKHYLYILYFLLFNFIFSSCDNYIEFIPPDLPEKLSVSAVFDINDSSRYISFERSFQRYYRQENDLKIDKLVYSISSSEVTLLKDSLSVEGWQDHLNPTLLPRDISFEESKTYTLYAKEENLSEITATSRAPSDVPIIQLAGIEPDIIITKCQFSGNLLVNKVGVINIVFEDRNSTNDYFTLVVKGTDYNGKDCNIAYDILYNYDFFQAPLPSYICLRKGSSVSGYVTFLHIYSSSYFDDIVFDNKRANISLTVEPKSDHGDGNFDYTKPITIRLLSIPKDLYDFAKSLNDMYTYGVDLFTEPVYLKSNVSGGHGIFAVCNSSSITLTLPWEEILNQQYSN